MIRLLLLRHAHAAPGGRGTEADHARDLDARGVREAAWVARSIAEAGWAPELALVSDATRTRHTAAAVAQALDPPPRIVHEAALYDASAADLLARLAALPPATRCCLLVGHNPGVATLAQRLAVSGEPEAHRRLAAGFPPAALAVVTAAGWAALCAEGGRLEAVLLPP